MGLWSSPLVSTLNHYQPSSLIMGSRVDTAGDNQNPNVIISNYWHDGRADNAAYPDKGRYRHDCNVDSQCLSPHIIIDSVQND